VPGALGNGPKTLGNYFAECNTRHTIYGMFLSVNSYLPSVFYRALGKLCRVSEKHSTKIYTWQNENAKKPKNNSTIFQKKISGEVATSQRPPVFIEVGAFFTLNSQLMRPAGFELTTSPSRVCYSTTALHSAYSFCCGLS